MKLLRVGNLNQEKAAIIDKNEIIRDLSSVVADFNPTTLNQKTIEIINNTNLEKLPKISNKTRVGACISNPQKFIGIGLNYIDHAEETGTIPPKEPIIFFKDSLRISKLDVSI